MQIAFVPGLICCALSAMLVAISGAKADQQSPYLSAADSDPGKLGWMRGSPPVQSKIVSHQSSDYFSFPKLRWTVCHFRELLPTKLVSRVLGAPIFFERTPDPEIDALTFQPSDGGKPITWRAALSATYTDGIVVLHRGRIVYERYAGCLREDGKHGAMSVTKSLVGLLAEILVVEGRLDETASVSSIIPELDGSAFASATVRQVMDMTTALDHSEDYSDPEAGVWKYTAAANPLPKPPGYIGPRGYYEYLQTVQASGPHGQTFAYKTLNTDTLGWIVQRVTGEPLTEFLSRRIWRRMGSEQDAYFTIDSTGTPFAGGGLSAGLRDLARVGQLMLGEGVLNGERLFSSEVVQRIRAGGDKGAFAQAGYSSLPGGSYRSMWWVLHNPHGAFAARGVHGQTIYVDPTAEMVIARFASHPVAANAAIDGVSLPAYQTVAEYLMEKPD